MTTPKHAAPEGAEREALERIAAMDPEGIRADDLGRAARIARDALTQGGNGDVLLRVIQRLNANPYNLTKSECIAEVQAMRAALTQGKQQAEGAVVRSLRHAGAMLSNCAFNLAQRKPGEPLTEADIRALDESRKAWDAALSAAASAPAGWMPIETAPKDGTLIMLGAPEWDGDGGVSLPGYWQKGWGDAPDEMGCDDGFVDCMSSVFRPARSFGESGYRFAGVQPTHWMPLPASPSLPVSGRGSHD